VLAVTHMILIWNNDSSVALNTHNNGNGNYVAIGVEMTNSMH
jgi:hypothetical protein